MKEQSRAKKRSLNDIFTAVLFAGFLGVFFLLCLFFPKQEISPSERRYLETFPRFSWERVESGRFFNDFDDYAADQFPGREGFRRLKAIERFYLMARAQNNGIYFSNGRAVKIETAIDEEMLAQNVALWDKVVSDFFPESNSYFAVIPDKNYFVSSLTPHWDYNAFLTAVKEGAPAGSSYIDLFPLLTLEDYYRTDIHWRQEALLPLAEKMAAAMGASIDGADAYRTTDVSDFYGVYYGQSALPLAREPLCCLESAVTDAAEVRLWQLGADGFFYTDAKVYTPVDAEEELSDPYDLFLSGPQSLIEVINPLSDNDKTLFVFRDSFGSSLSPLLLSGYHRVVLVDLRYRPLSYLGQVEGLDLTCADLLFLYTTTTLNTMKMR